MKFVVRISMVIFISANCLSAQDTLDSLVQPKKYFGLSFYGVLKSEFAYGITENELRDYFKVYSNLVPGFEDSLSISPYLTSRIFSRLLSFEIPLSHKLLLNEETYPVLRFATGYSEKTSYKFASIQQIFPWDTTVSMWTGNPVYVDSVVLSQYIMTNEYLEIPMEISFMYFNSWGSRVSGFFGLGISTSVSFSSIVDVTSNSYYIFKGRDSANAEYSSLYDRHGSGIGQKDATKKSAGPKHVTTEIFLPFGFGLGIGRKPTSRRALHFFYECRIGYALTEAQDLGKLNSLEVYNAFGIRTNWGRR